MEGGKGITCMWTANSALLSPSANGVGGGREGKEIGRNMMEGGRGIIRM